MTKQTIYLFIRAFIFGVLINIGLQQVSDTPSYQTEIIAPQQVEIIIGQVPTNIDIPFLDPVNN